MQVLSTLIGQSLLGAGVLFGLPSKQNKLAEGISMVFMVTSLLLAYQLWQEYDPTLSGFQLIERFSWVPSMGMEYHLGVDGISVALILVLVMTNAIVVWSAPSLIADNIALYLGCFYLMQAIVVGVFSALDGMLFYLFWEATLIPLYICIGIWGSEERVKAACKFFLYTFFGSAPFLVAIVYLGVRSGSFDIESFFTLPLTWQEQSVLFWACTLAFAVKVPMWPVHTWLPDAHTQAPAGGSVMLAALMLKVGAFGFYRFILPVMPEACYAFAPVMVGLSLFSVVFIGLVTLAQSDIKKLIAYASIAHMGIVTMGIFLIFLLEEGLVKEGGMLALEGSVIQMVAHAFSSGGLFLAFGLIYQRLHTRNISDFGGLAKVMPKMTALFVVFALSNLGLPGTGGFVGEMLVIIASYQVHLGLALATASTVVLSAAYTLWMIKRVCYGRITNTDMLLIEDIKGRETFVLGVLTLLVLWVGLFPGGWAHLLAQSCQDIMEISLELY